MKLLLLTPLLFIGCSCKPTTITTTLYCDYVELPSINEKVVPKLDITISVDRQGIVQGLTSTGLSSILTNYGLQTSIINNKDEEIEWYRAKLTRHNDMCTNKEALKIK